MPVSEREEKVKLKINCPSSLFPSLDTIWNYYYFKAQWQCNEFTSQQSHHQRDIQTTPHHIRSRKLLCTNFSTTIYPTNEIQLMRVPWWQDGTGQSEWERTATATATRIGDNDDDDGTATTIQYSMLLLVAVLAACHPNRIVTSITTPERNYSKRVIDRDSEWNDSNPMAVTETRTES